METNRDYQEYLKCLGFEESLLVVPTQKLSSPQISKANPIESKTKLIFLGEDLFENEARQLLDKMISAMKLSTDAVLLVDPKSGDFEKKLADENPLVVVSLGDLALKTALKNDANISSLRGQIQVSENLKRRDASCVKLMPTYHPSYLLMNPEAKREAWADLQTVMKIIEESKS
ncbi:MAG: DNA polymerase III subunit psi [Proteobacteria bacterium]|nr:DNA polymerase III subunit psi [Pseudomonadota bacterium]